MKYIIVFAFIFIGCRKESLPNQQKDTIINLGWGDCIDCPSSNFSDTLAIKRWIEMIKEETTAVAY